MTSQGDAPSPPPSRRRATMDSTEACDVLCIMDQVVPMQMGPTKSSVSVTNVQRKSASKVTFADVPPPKQSGSKIKSFWFPRISQAHKDPVEKIQNEDLGIAFNTRAALGSGGRNSSYLYWNQPVKTSASSDEQGSSVPADSSWTWLDAKLLWPSCSAQARRHDQVMKISAIVSCVFVVGAYGVEPACTPDRLYLVLEILHALNAGLYAVLCVVGRLLVGIVDTSTRQEVTSLRAALLCHLRTLGFWLDVAASLGFIAELVHLFETDILVGASEVAPSLWVMQLQLTKIWRIVVKPEAAQRDGNEDTFIQGVFRIFLNLLLFGHVMASCLLAVGNRESAGGFVSWVDVSLAGIDSCPVLYMDALYFAVISLTSVGYSDALVTSLEHSVNCVFLLLAQLYSAKVCADLTWTISIFNCQEAEFLGRRAQIVLSLKHLGVPKGLVDRVIAFQNYVAHVHIEDLTQPVFSGLSENLLMELQLCAYRELVLQAPFMRNQSKEAILLIVGSLRDAVFLPADFIMRHGEHKRELYFVRRGTAAVFGGVDPPSFCHSAELTHFEKGAYFGEMGMLTGRPRTAWVMARSYCICAVLPYSAVGVLSQEYPGSFTHLVQSMVGVYNMRSKTSWPELSRRFAKHGLRTTEAAYRWCCRQAGGDEDSEVTAKRFDEGLRKLNVCGFDRQVLWAEIDNDNSGIICLQEFEDLINVEGAINGTYVSENAEQSRNSQGVGDEVEQSLQYRNSWMSDVGAGGKGDQDLRGSTRSSACIEKEDLKRTISCGSSASLLSEMPSMSGHAASRGTHAWGVVRGPTIDSVPPLPGMTSLTGAHQGDPTLEALQEVQAALYEAGDRLNEPIRKIIGQQNRASFASRASSEGPVFGPNRESCRSYASGRQIRTSEGSWMAE
eukprot:TRINITY_DN1885_c0_g3_i3.p1 TRINITY_DN1885_c0_g3~~TRINITY_DN1885_c0_g3_i3.p1  ORF type:complete len:897 (+),score=152.51 TRINITY_DN1885_c0_g3_i3:99-2789(+)